LATANPEERTKEKYNHRTVGGKEAESSEVKNVERKEILSSLKGGRLAIDRVTKRSGGTTHPRLVNLTEKKKPSVRGGKDGPGKEQLDTKIEKDQSVGADRKN